MLVTSNLRKSNFGNGVINFRKKMIMKVFKLIKKLFDIIMIYLKNEIIVLIMNLHQRKEIEES